MVRADKSLVNRKDSVDAQQMFNGLATPSETRKRRRSVGLLYPVYLPRQVNK